MNTTIEKRPLREQERDREREIHATLKPYILSIKASTVLFFFDVIQSFYIKLPPRIHRIFFSIRRCSLPSLRINAEHICIR